MKQFKIIKEYNAKTGVHANSQNVRIIWTKEIISADDLRNIHYSYYKGDTFAMGIFSISSIDKLNISIENTSENGYLHEYKYYTYCD